MLCSSSSRFGSGLVGILCIGLLSACSGDDENNKKADVDMGGSTQADMKVEQDAGATDMTASSDMTASMEGIPSAYEARYEMRFESLKFTKETIPQKDAIINILNGALKTNFNQTLASPIVILLDVKDINAEAKTLKIRSGAGVKTVNEEEYEWDPLTPKPYVDGTLKTETGEIEGLIPEFVFIATLGEGAGAMKVPLTINDLKFTATLENADTAGKAKITTGRLEGYMTKANGDTAMVELSPGNPSTLTSVFGEENLDYDSDNDGTPDGWALYATFTARPTSID